MASRALALVALRLEREVDHHDGVLFHDADQHDDSHERVKVQFLVKEQQRQQRADAGGGQAGKNRDGMNEAFVQNSQNDVDHQNGRHQQQPHARERVLETPAPSLGTCVGCRGQNLEGLRYSTSLVASPKATPGFRLKLMVTAGKLSQVIHGERPTSRAPAWRPYPAESACRRWSGRKAAKVCRERSGIPATVP